MNSILGVWGENQPRRVLVWFNLVRIGLFFMVVGVTCKKNAPNGAFLNG